MLHSCLVDPGSRSKAVSFVVESTNHTRDPDLESLCEDIHQMLSSILVKDGIRILYKNAGELSSRSVRFTV